MNPVLLDEIMAHVQTMPALSPAAMMALRVIDDPKSAARDVSRVVLTDQVMTAQILRLANSSYYGSPRRFTTVSDAITFLGFREMRSVVMVVALQPVMSNKTGAYELHRGDLWQHSLATASCAHHVARASRYLPPEEAFIAGLVHDIGKVALGHALGERFRDVLVRVRSDGLDFLQAELDEFGMGHDEVGAVIAEKWGLPPHLREAIAHHHRWDAKGEHLHLAAIVHLSDYIAGTLGLGVAGDTTIGQTDPEAIAALGMSEQEIQAVMSDLASRSPQQILRVVL